MMNFDDLKNMFHIFPIMGYYLLESMLSALPVYFVWRFIFFPKFGINFSYLEVVAMIWLVKVLFFDIFKLIMNIPASNTNNDNKENKT